MAADEFPPLLTELHALEFDYAEGNGIDFEPYEAFDPEDTQAWIRAWTGNEELTGSEYRVFGQDGTGGMAAFWLTREGADLFEQPIVFFGSEGELGVVAYDFQDYLWLLAAGIGPLEAVEYGADDERVEQPDFVAFAEKHALGAKKTAAEILRRAQEAFPTFNDDFMALCRH